MAWKPTERRQSEGTEGGRFLFWSDRRAAKLGKLIDLAKSPGFRKTLATIAGSAGYVALGEAGYTPGVQTTAGLDAEQVRVILSAGFAVAGYLIPSGVLEVVRNWANILGKESAARITAIEIRVSALEEKAAK